MAGFAKSASSGHTRGYLSTRAPAKKANHDTETIVRATRAIFPQASHGLEASRSLYDTRIPYHSAFNDGKKVQGLSAASSRMAPVSLSVDRL